MTTYDAIADAFGFGEIKNYDWFTLGKVTAVDGTKLKVLLGGSSVPADCESYCGAQVGDVVLVVIMKGIARAVAVKGGGDYLPITGGTLTGQLEIPDSAVTDASQTPSANQYGSALHVTDQQGEQVGYLGLVHGTDDNLWTQLGVTRDVNGTPAYNSLWLGLKDDGTPTVRFSGSDAQKAWRDALGYTDTDSVSGVFTKESSVTIRWFRCTKWGNVVSASMSWSTSRAISVPANGNITDFLIGTFAAGYRPPAETHGVSSGDSAGAAWYYIGTNGKLQVGACEGTGSARTIAANTAFDFHAVWVV